MKTIRIVLLAIVVSCMANVSKAQTLNFDLQIKNLKLGSGSNTIYLNSFDSLQFTLLNNGTDSFAVNGGGVSMLRFYYYVDTMVQNPTPFSYLLTPTDSVDVAMPNFLNPGDSIQLRTLIQFPPTIFTKFKDNEIVIWPKFQPTEASPQNNSARIFVYCDDIAATENIALNANEISVFPNPCSDKIKFEINGFNNHYQYEIFNNMGKLVYQSSSIISKNMVIDFDDLNTNFGTYLIRVFNSEKSITTKIIYGK